MGAHSFSAAEFRSEIERCEHCVTKPCEAACPAHCSPSDFILASRVGNPSDFVRASQEILKQNPLGHVCGLVCPDTLCMDACSRKKSDRPLEIPKIQATILERARKARGGVPAPAKLSLNGKKIGIVGSGPAGLAAAAFLARRGYAVDLFEAEKKSGGACRQIPELRLPRGILEEEIRFVKTLGAVRILTGKRVQGAQALLQNPYDAVLVAVGAPDAALLGIPGEENAIQSTEFLKNPKNFKLKNKKVAVVGGGAVAIDCAVTAKMQGADWVELFVRRSASDMPITELEWKMLLENQIELTTRTRLLSISRGRNQKLRLRLTRTCPQRGKLVDEGLTELGRSGFDFVMLAIDSKREGKRSQTQGLYYAGDCVHGGSTVVEAVASGKNAAARIDFDLREGSQEELKSLQSSARKLLRGRVKSRIAIPGIAELPVSLQADFFGFPITSPFLLSAGPATDGFEQMQKAYEAGWSGGVVKTAFDNVPIHVPGAYMFSFGKRTQGNCDNVSAHPLDQMCRAIEKLRGHYPDRLTLGSTGGPISGQDERDAPVWQSNTRKLENAGACGVEYSLSCPQGGDECEGELVSQSAEVTAKVIDWVLSTGRGDVPKLFKLTASVTSIQAILNAIQKVLAKHPGKKAGITLANSFPVLAFRRGSGRGRRWDEGVVVGMSGEGVLPISLLTVAKASAFSIPISANGGVMDYQAAADFFALGARSVQVCTVVARYGLSVVRELESGLSHFLKARGFSSVAELVGCASPNPITAFNDLSAAKPLSHLSLSSLCTGCGNCTRCPYFAIRLDRRARPVIDPARCIGCQLCVLSCFPGALSMRSR